MPLFSIKKIIIYDLKQVHFISLFHDIDLTVSSIDWASLVSKSGSQSNVITTNRTVALYRNLYGPVDRMCIRLIFNPTVYDSYTSF